MKSNEERVRLLYEKAARIKRKRETVRLIVSGSISFMLLVSLGAVLFNTVGFSFVEPVPKLTGSSLLGENTGAYVLIAVISFFTAVFLTAFLMRRQSKKNMTGDDSMENREEKTQ